MSHDCSHMPCIYTLPAMHMLLLLAATCLARPRKILLKTELLTGKQAVLEEAAQHVQGRKRKHDMGKTPYDFYLAEYRALIKSWPESDWC